MFKYWSPYVSASEELSLQTGVKQALEAIWMFREDPNHSISCIIVKVLNMNVIFMLSPLAHAYCIYF